MSPVVSFLARYDAMDAALVGAGLASAASLVRSVGSLQPRPVVATAASRSVTLMLLGDSRTCQSMSLNAQSESSVTLRKIAKGREPCGARPLSKLRGIRASGGERPERQLAHRFYASFTWPGRQLPSAPTSERRGCDSRGHCRHPEALGKPCHRAR